MASSKLGWISILLSMFSILIASGAVYISWENSQQEKLEIKRDVIKRIVGYSYRLTEGRTGQDGEPFIALNQAYVIFADHPPVIAALVKFHDEPKINPTLTNNMVTLIKSMAEASALPVQASNLTDKFLTAPFTPPQINCPGHCR